MYGWLHMKRAAHNPLRAIFQDPRRRTSFEDALKTVFPACIDPPSARMEEALRRMQDTDQKTYFGEANPARR
jgi:hypothetical protein